jgi:phosphopantetheinyl transferase
VLQARAAKSGPRSESGPTAAHVWSFPLQCSTREERQLSTLLDADETARAGRLATRELWRRFVVSHGVLRLLLGSLAGEDPRAIRILIGERGKPHVAGHQPHFSLSHSGDLALVAVASGGPVGVDVERVRADLAMDEIMQGLLSAADQASIEALPLTARLRAWFQAWTRLEAGAKASGDGILVHRASVPSSFRTWDLCLDEAHVGTVATTPSVTHVVCEALPHLARAMSRLGTA